MRLIAQIAPVSASLLHRSLRPKLCQLSARSAVRRSTTEERTKLVTRQERIDDFIHEGSPPNNQPLQILCEDHVGTYVIPFPCRWRDGLWENAKTSRRIEATVIGWRALNKTQR